MDHISVVLRGLLEGRRLSQGIRNHSCFSRWPDVVGPHLAQVTRPLRVQGTTLWVWVENPILQHHLTYLTPKLLERLRGAAPGSTIDQVRFTLNPEP